MTVTQLCRDSKSIFILSTLVLSVGLLTGLPAISRHLQRVYGPTQQVCALLSANLCCVRSSMIKMAACRELIGRLAQYDYDLGSPIDLTAVLSGQEPEVHGLGWGLSTCLGLPWQSHPFNKCKSMPPGPSSGVDMPLPRVSLRELVHCKGPILTNSLVPYLKKPQHHLFKLCLQMMLVSICAYIVHKANCHQARASLSDDVPTSMFKTCVSL